MPGQPCANHPNEITYVRCGRCEKPICVRCMVDSPVGKKCRECARNRNHLSESTPRQVLLAFTAATAVAIPLGFVMHGMGGIGWILVPFIYGYLVGEVALRAGQRRRSLAMQVAAGLAALIGSAVGMAPLLLLTLALIQHPVPTPPETEAPVAFHFTSLTWPLIRTGIGIIATVSRVRFL